MGRKNKLQRFADVAAFPNVIEPALDEVIAAPHAMRGKWKSDFFKNEKPLILELGCGKGEYTVGLAQRFPHTNFLGVDIKGNRIWRGAKTALEEKIYNAGFLRTRIEFIDRFFISNEVDEIWITFPDPQPKDRQIKKRLTGPVFLKKYFGFLKPSGIIHLKTDSPIMYNYTLEVIEEQKHHLLFSTPNLYKEDAIIKDPDVLDILSIKTHYEKLFSEKGEKIHYLKFQLNPSAF